VPRLRWFFRSHRRSGKSLLRAVARIGVQRTLSRTDRPAPIRLLANETAHLLSTATTIGNSTETEQTDSQPRTNGRDETNRAESALIRARRFVSLGMSVIPLKRRSKKPAGHWKEFQDRHATDAELIAWFGEEEGDPDANIGIVVGSISGIVVVDADNQAGEAWAATNLPYTPMQTRTAKGRHFVFGYPREPLVTKLRVSPVAGAVLDVLTDRHYIVAPGSTHPDGPVYTAEGCWTSIADRPVFDHKWFPSNVWPSRSLSSGSVRTDGIKPAVTVLSEWRPRASSCTESRYLPLPSPLSRPSSETGRGTPIGFREAGHHGCRTRWIKEYNRFIALWNERRAFREGTRANAVMVYAYLLRRTLHSDEEIGRAAEKLARQCVPPLPHGEIWHRVRCGMYTLTTNLSRNGIDNFLAVTDEERQVLDPQATNRLIREEARQDRRRLADAALREFPTASVRFVSAVLRRRGVEVPTTTLWRQRNKLANGGRDEDDGRISCIRYGDDRRAA
jgi:hypothetical protein